MAILIEVLEEKISAEVRALGATIDADEAGDGIIIDAPAGFVWSATGSGALHAPDDEQAAYADGLTYYRYQCKQREYLLVQMADGLEKE